MLKTDEQEVDMSRISMRTFLSIIGLAMALLLSAAPAMAIGVRQAAGAKTEAKPVDMSVPGELIVKVKPSSAGKVKVGGNRFGTSSLDRLCADAKVKTIARACSQNSASASSFKQREARAPGNAVAPSVGSIYRVQTDGTDVVDAARKFAADPDIEYAEPDFMLRLDAVTNDPYYSGHNDFGTNLDDQWDLQKVKAADAWAANAKGQGTIIAVIDTGVNINHEDLQGNVWTNPGESGGGKETNGKDDDGDGYVDDVHGWNWVSGNNDVSDAVGHGTDVAGIAAASTNNGKGIAGASWYSKIMALRIVDGPPYSNWVPEVAASQAILYAADHGADVINMSFSTTYNSKCIRDAVQYAFAHGCVMVGSAGNDVSTQSSGDFGQTMYPGAFNEVLCASATDQNDAACNWSMHNFGVDVGVPGGSSGSSSSQTDTIISTSASGNSSYSTFGGTSASAPLLSGAAACVVGAHPTWTNEQVMAAITGSAEDKGQSGWDPYFGYGRLNMGAAVAANPVVSYISSPEIGAYGNGTAVPVRGSASGAAFKSYQLFIGQGQQPTTWLPGYSTLANGGTKAVTDGLLGTIDFSTRDYTAFTIRLVVHTTGADREFRTIFINTGGQQTQGYPMNLGWGPQQSTPCLYDVNGDGVLETAVAVNSLAVYSGPLGLPWTSCMHQAIYILKPDGTPLPGWPKYFDEKIPNTMDFYRAQILVSDLEQNGSPEVIVATTGQLRVYTATGQLKWSAKWDQMGLFPDSYGPTWLCDALALGDVNGDGIKEVTIRVDDFAGPLAGTEDTGFGEYFRTGGRPTNPQGPDLDYTARDVTWSSVVAYSSTGVPLFHSSAFPGGPYHRGTEVIRPFPGMACFDIDKDKKDEIVTCGFNKGVYAFNESGAKEAGWPFYTNGSLENETPAIGDIDNDGKTEIVVSARNSDKNTLYILRPDGTVWPSKPISNYGRSPILADCDADGRLEIITNGYWYDPQTKAIHGGLQVSHCIPGVVDTVKFEGQQATSKLAVGDVDSDGKLEAVFGDGLGTLEARNLDDGSLVPGFPASTCITGLPDNPESPYPYIFKYADYMSIRDPLVADNDGDGKVEILAMSDKGYLNSWETAGTCPRNRRYWSCEGGSPGCLNQYSPYPLWTVTLSKTLAKNADRIDVEIKGDFIQCPIDSWEPYTYFYDSQGINHRIMLTDDGTHKRFTGYFWTTGLPDGLCTVYAHGSNYTGESVFGTATFTMDKTGPVMTFTSPAAGFQVKRGVSFGVAAKASDNAKVTKTELLVDNVSQGYTSWGTGVTLCTGTWTYKFPTTAALGAHTLTATGTDSLGNVASASMTVTVIP